ncbi:MAG: hypothetical protein HY535_08945 [Chloroflexi bacterium]|nr:hypothetical protein [Chloroflexota bacterium]
MTTKAFVLLLVVVLALGGSIGGAFAGGMAMGKSQGKKEASSALPARSTSGAGQQFQGEMSQEQLQQLRQQFQGQSGQGSRTGFMGGGGLTGTVESVQGNTLTVNTPQGPLRAAIGADTTIQKLAKGTLQDLTKGLRVTVVGQRGEDGTLAAQSVLITPEGAGEFFFGDRQQRDQRSP